MQSATRELIDTSFRKLRSAEGACELLQNFKHIKSKGAIQKQVINKFNDILEQVRCNSCASVYVGLCKCCASM
jgi:dynein heavy chain